MAETAEHGFTPEQLAWLERRFNAVRPAAFLGFDRATIMWIIGGLTALGWQFPESSMRKSPPSWTKSRRTPPRWLASR